jgi:flagellar FliJ protein
VPKRFSFRLQRVLEYREQLETRARMELAVATRAHQEQSALVEGLRERLAGHEASLDGRRNLSEGDLWLWRMYKSRLEQDISIAEQELFQRAKRLNACRQEAVKTAKEKKTLERLRASQETAFNREENAREQREADEMATLRYENGTL